MNQNQIIVQDIPPSLSQPQVDKFGDAWGLGRGAQESLGANISSTMTALGLKFCTHLIVIKSLQKLKKAVKCKELCQKYMGSNGQITLNLPKWVSKEIKTDHT